VHPNPLAARGAIAYELAAGGRVRLAVHDVAGRTVAVLVDATQRPGRYELAWGGVDGQGQALPAGIYFLRLAAPGLEAREKVVLTR
jgi:hypothetical protein